MSKSTLESINKCIASYPIKLPHNQEMKAWQTDICEQLGQLASNAPEVEGHEAAYAPYAMKCEIASRVIDYKLRTYNHKITCEMLLKAFSRLPGKHPYASRPPRKTRTAVEEALLVYGSPARALDALRPQLAVAGELGLDEIRQRKLSNLISTLETAST